MDGSVDLNWYVDPAFGSYYCIGFPFRHVALLTDLFCSLAELKPKLQHSVNTVLIVNEENQIVQGIGADGLDECGKVVLNLQV